MQNKRAHWNSQDDVGWKMICGATDVDGDCERVSKKMWHICLYEEIDAWKDSTF